jgi:hypothetical protein
VKKHNKPDLVAPLEIVNRLFIIPARKKLNHGVVHELVYCWLTRSVVKTRIRCADYADRL